jgi:hypothetical protein
MSDYVDPDRPAPMEWLHEPTNLLFKWPPGSRNIEVGRLAEYKDGRARLFDQNVNLYDYATGRVEIEPTYEAFKARCLEWLQDSELIESEDQDHEEE